MERNHVTGCLVNRALLQADDVYLIKLIHGSTQNVFSRVILAGVNLPLHAPNSVKSGRNIIRHLPAPLFPRIARLTNCCDARRARDKHGLQPCRHKATVSAAIPLSRAGV
jgi:hypothetical protein